MNRWGELTSFEQRMAKALAKERTRVNKDAGVSSQMIFKKLSDLEAQTDGVGAEIMFCRLHNLYPDLNTDLRSYQSEDCWTHSGMGVDVKNTNHHTGHLLLPVYKVEQNKVAEVYALVIGTFPMYKYIGWIFADSLIKPEHIKDFGSGPTYAMAQSQLNTGALP